MKNKISVKIRSAICDCKTGNPVALRPWRKNLVYDDALTVLAVGGSGFAAFFGQCLVGSGSLVNSVGPGATTFTQSGTTLTASTAAWFITNGISAGWLMKQGTGAGGAESYITSINSGGTSCELSTTASVVAETFTAWNVAQSVLPGFLYSTETYNSTGNSTSFAGNICTLTRVFNFPVQSSVYSVSCIGYSAAGSSGGAVNGAISLATPDTVNIDQFYQVTIQITFTATPAAPTVVGNVTSGIDTSGNFMLQAWDCQTVSSVDGSTTSLQPHGTNLIDGGPAGILFLTAGAPVLNSSISAAAVSITGAGYSSGSLANFIAAGPVGLALCTIPFNQVTAGETLYSIAFGNITNASAGSVEGTQFLVVNLANPATLPTGVFSGYLVLTRTFTRNLIN